MLENPHVEPTTSLDQLLNLILIINCQKLTDRIP